MSNENQPKDKSGISIATATIIAAIIALLGAVIGAAAVYFAPRDFIVRFLSEPSLEARAHPSEQATLVTAITNLESPTAENSGQMDAGTTKPTQTFTLSPTPAETSSPTHTPTLIVTEALQPTADLLFSDDFGDGIDNSWTIEPGTDNYEIVNNTLTATDDLFLSIGETQWTDYVVEVTVVKARSGITRGNYIAVRHKDDNMVAIAFAGNPGASLYLSNDGIWRQVPNSIYYKSANNNVIKVVVKGKDISVYVGLDKVATYRTEFLEGKVGLKITSGTIVADFKVSRLN